MPAPTSTYRLQLNKDFTLFDAAKTVPYLADLGVDAVYLSPVLQCVAGSNHGYDWTDPDVIDAERGGEEGWRAFVAAARGAGLKIVVDIVPNHMGIADPAANKQWTDVLRHGRESQFGNFFDIDWSRPKIGLPVLGSNEDLELLEFNDDHSALRYYDKTFPIAPGTWHDGDSPRAVHDRQRYQLRSWRDANDVLSYRRFFAITTLAGLRVDDEAVAEATHQRIFRMITEDHIDGLRVDHPDGLADPGAYLAWLRRRVGELGAPDTWIVIEKIVEPGERLLPQWPVDGTSGYDSMTAFGQVFVDQSAAETFTDSFVASTDGPLMADAMLAGKREIAAAQFPPELRRLRSLLSVQAPTDSVDAALIEIAAHLGVYRTYLPDGAQLLDEAAARAKTSRPELAETIDQVHDQIRRPGTELATRFEQFTGAVMAKGVEDTAYYRANRLIGLNEVGGDPLQFGSSLHHFHDEQLWRAEHQPRSMTSLSTHDTKRSEDIRARLAALSELADEWLTFWDVFRATLTPSEPVVAWLLAQTMAATGPIEAPRLVEYALKAAREAGLATRWIDGDPDYEARLAAGVAKALGDAGFMQAWQQLDETLRIPGRTVALGQKLVALTAPGIPDCYQGTELWDDSLVDPDNRRPVDYAKRAELLNDAPIPALADDNDGRTKMQLVSETLRLRRVKPEAFRGYAPIVARGLAAGHAIAFDRGGSVTIATRLPVGLARLGGWSDTEIDVPRASTDLFTGRHLTPGAHKVGEILHRYPIALLVG